jgi:Flp pilus assembly protein TadG
VIVRAALAARGWLARFRGERRGGVVVWLALATPPLAALCVLSVDVARVYNLEAELQTGADALARAGAVELDGDDDAIARAQAAVANLVRNDRRFADARGGPVRVQATRFLDALPASDASPVTADYETTNSKDARYLEVTVSPERITTLFPPEIAAGLVSVSLSAKSVGGRMAQMCGAAPLFICNPVEDDTGTTLKAALEDPSYRGRQLLLRGKGGTSDFRAGAVRLSGAARRRRRQRHEGLLRRGQPRHLLPGVRRDPAHRDGLVGGPGCEHPVRASTAAP